VASAVEDVRLGPRKREQHFTWLTVVGDSCANEAETAVMARHPPSAKLLVNAHFRETLQARDLPGSAL
jgi:hypothetical protein